ncbi:MAG TPA: hypothetical protein VN414_14020 [Methanosarcina sp.]|nr:hypothetical protein [Methanosarcina sp.]
MDPSNHRVLSDEFSTEGNDIVTESVQTTGPNITEIQITTNKSASFYPAIYDNRIVWMDFRNEDDDGAENWDIYMYDLSTSKETQITSEESYESILTSTVTE